VLVRLDQTLMINPLLLVVVAVNPRKIRTISLYIRQLEGAYKYKQSVYITLCTPVQTFRCAEASLRRTEGTRRQHG
jgi:hypothetical protein